MENPELASVIIPSYKRTDTLSRAIDSVLRQTHKDVEIIVVNDNDPATDDAIDTHKIVEQYRMTGKPVIHVAHPRNLGGNAARNTGIRNSRGKWIAFLDSDDEFEPKKLELQIRALRTSNTTLSGACCATKRALDGRVYEERGEALRVNSAADVILYRVDLGGTSTFMSHRELFDHVGMFDESLIRQQEIEFWARCLAFGPILCLGESLVVRHEDDRSNIPDTKRYFDNKEHFLELVERSLPNDSTLKREAARIHYLDVAKVALRNRDWWFAIKMVLLARPNAIGLLKLFNSGVRVLKRGG